MFNNIDMIDLKNHQLKNLISNISNLCSNDQKCGASDLAASNVPKSTKKI
jgi:hypothetical protein